LLKNVVIALFHHLLWIGVDSEFSWPFKQYTILNQLVPGRVSYGRGSYFLLLTHIRQAPIRVII
jgi:hypothetical protein